MISEAIRQRGVFFVTRKWPPAVGGMETYSVELTRELALHVPVEIVSLPGRADGSPPRASAFVGFALSAARRYARRKIPPAIVHVGDLAAWPLGLLASTRRPRAAIVVSAHGTDVSYHRRKTAKGRLYGAYLRLGARLLGCATVIANSSATAAVAAETGWRTTKVVPLATSIEDQRPPSGHGGDLLFAGRLVERKGCAWFVRNVLPLLPDTIGLRVAGPVWDEAEGAALDHSRVSCLGPLNARELLDEYREALCVVVPNIETASGEFEGFGLVAPEAAAAGGVVVAAASGGLVDAVIDGETGFLVPSGDAEAWRATIIEIAGWSDEQRAAFTSAAMETARKHYGWSRVADDVLTVYQAAAH